MDGVAYFETGWAEYWRSDGTAAGTRRLLAVPGTAVGSTTGFMAFGDEVVFGVAHGPEGFRFMATDGTAAGTRALDVVPGVGPAPKHWQVAGGYLYFDFDHGLWRTDGTRTGTVLIDGARGILDLTSVGGTLVAFVNGSLMTVAPGATEAAQLAESEVAQELDGRLYFGTVRGMESWAPGETATVVHDVPPRLRFASTGPGEMARSAGRLFWAGDTLPSDGSRLYTAGPDGARLVSEDVVDPAGFLALGDGRVLFFARDRRTNVPVTGMWVSDGTAAGTRPILSTYAFGPEGALVRTPNGVIGPGRSEAAGDELHRLDGTLSTFDLLVDINRRTVGSDPSDAARVGDRVVFKTNEQQVLWVTDGTYDGTVRLLERDGGGRPLDPFGIASDGTTALFAARDGIYRTDGTPAGTAAIADIGAAPESFAALARVGTTSVFTARGVGEDTDASDLWRTDGTAAGTRRLTTGARLSFPAVALGGAGTMLVWGYGGLWATDGTAAGSRQLFADPGSFGSEAIEVDDGFLAGAKEPVHGDELWHLDRDGRNPRLVKDLVPGAEGAYPRRFGRAGDRVLFVAQGGQWQALDLATEQVEPMTWLQGRGLAVPPATEGGVTYISTYDTYNVFLYRTDGTRAGTQLLRRFDGSFLDVPDGFTRFDGVTWFVAEDAEHGVELWRTDGTAAGTQLARDILPGPRPSYPLDLVATDDFLFFTAFDDEHGPEPWRIRRAARPAPGESPPPPVTISPLPLPEATPQPAGAPPVLPRRTATLSARARRLKTLRGATRWRVTGTVTGTTCTGRVQVVLGRRERVLKRTAAPLRRCAFSATVATRSRASGRWLQVRTVPSAALADVKSRRIRVAPADGRM